MVTLMLMAASLAGGAEPPRHRPGRLAEGYLRNLVSTASGTYTLSARRRFADACNFRHISVMVGWCVAAGRTHLDRHRCFPRRRNTTTTALLQKRRSDMACPARPVNCNTCNVAAGILLAAFIASSPGRGTATVTVSTTLTDHGAGGRYVSTGLTTLRVFLRIHSAGGHLTVTVTTRRPFHSTRST